MQPVPRIFVSATSRDLRTARGLVSEGLRRMECLPIVQDDFPPDYKSVRDMLRTKIQTCNAVVHLAGFYYGAEPQPVIPGPDRRSFTQMEYEIAMELNLPCYVFLCGRDFPFDPHDPEPEEKQQLQLDHRERLLKRDELFYEFASPEELANRTRELQLSVEGLRKELARERNRRRLAMVAAVAALAIAVVGGIWMHGRQKQQEAVNVAQTSEIASLKAQLEGPWAVVNKVNAAMEMMRQQKAGTEEEMKTAAITLVATEMKKTPAEIKQAIDSSAELAQKLIVAARAEGDKDASKREESRRLEAETYIKLAASHEAAANYTEALAAYQKAFELMDPKTQPEEWLDTLCSIADMQGELGREEESRDNFIKAVQFGMETPALGVGHRLTVFASDSLTSHYRFKEKNYAAAEKMMRESLAQRSKNLGPNDPKTLAAMGDLSELLAEQKQFEEASTIALKALEASEKVYGEDNKVTIDIVNNLAGIFEEADDMETAIEMKRRVVDFKVKTLGDDSGSTLATQTALAGMLKRNGDLKEAKKLYTHVLETREKTLGPDHPDTLFSEESVAGMLRREKDYEGAEKLYRSVLAAREKIQGPDHPDTLDTQDNVAAVLWDQDDLAGAEKLYRRGLKAREAKYGPGDVRTIDSVKNVAELRDLQEDYPAAEELYRRVLKFQEAELKETDPDLAATYYHLATVLVQQDQNDKALPLARKAVLIAKESLPEDSRQRASYEKLLAKLNGGSANAAPEE